MTTWILIVLIQSVSAYGQFSVSTFTQEFTSRDNCIAAETRIQAAHTDSLIVNSQCTEK